MSNLNKNIIVKAKLISPPTYCDLAKRNIDVSYCRKSLNYQGCVLHLLIAFVC